MNELRFSGKTGTSVTSDVSKFENEWMNRTNSAVSIQGEKPSTHKPLMMWWGVKFWLLLHNYCITTDSLFQCPNPAPRRLSTLSLFIRRAGTRQSAHNWNNNRWERDGADKNACRERSKLMVFIHSTFCFQFVFSFFFLILLHFPINFFFFFFFFPLENVGIQPPDRKKGKHGRNVSWGWGEISKKAKKKEKAEAWKVFHHWSIQACWTFSRGLGSFRQTAASLCIRTTPLTARRVVSSYPSRNRKVRGDSFVLTWHVLLDYRKCLSSIRNDYPSLLAAL